LTQYVAYAKFKLMKQRSTTPVSRGFAAKSVLVAAAVLMAIAAPLAAMPRAKADKYDDQINALQQQANQFQSQANQLQAQANTLANKLSELAVQKSNVQTQIQLSQAQYDKLLEQIKQTEQKIKDNQDALGSTIANLYVDGTVSPLEMLASSKNIGDYVDKQTYQSSIQDQLTKTISTIKDLKSKLESDQTAVKSELDKQTAQKNSLTAIETQQQAILVQTQGQEAAYQSQVASAQSQIQDAHTRQQAYYASLIASSPNGGGSGAVGSFVYANWSGNRGCGTGGYPYCGAQDSYSDPYALFNRECVSYVALALHDRFGKYVAPFNGQGNAKEWPYSAPAYSGAQRVYSPQAGDAVILPADGSFAPIGHAMIVESVNGEWMHVSQYNFYGTGEYSTMDIKNSGIILLRFPNR
jgi:peptidoglycan hydrolase CwlO-like protein